MTEPSIAPVHDPGALSRAVELAVGAPVVGPAPVISALEPLSTAKRMVESAGVLARTRELPVEELRRTVQRGGAFLAHVAGGWLVANRNRLVFVTSTGERRISPRLASLREVTGGGAVTALALERRLGLEPLSVRSIQTKSPWARLRAWMRLESVDLLSLVLYSVVLGALSLAVPIAVQVLVNTIAFGSLLQPLVILSGLLLVVLVLTGLLQVVQAYVVEVLQRRIFVRMAEDLVRRIPRLAGDRDFGELSTRFFEVVNLQKAISKLLLDGLGLVLQTVVGLLLLSFYHPFLLAFDVGLILALAGVIALGYGGVPSAIRESYAKYHVATWLQAVAHQQPVFQRSPASVYAAIKGDALTRAYLDTRRRHYRRVLRQLIGGVSVQVLAMTALLGVGGFLVMRGELTLGQLVAAELVVGMIGAGFAKVGKQLETGYDLLAGLDKLGSLLDLELNEEATPDKELFTVRSAAVDLKDVHLEHWNGPGVNFHVAAGARLQLVGAQASDLLSLIAGLDKQAKGKVEILCEGQRLNTAAMRRVPCLLIRPGDVVQGTVWDNLRLADPTLEEARAMAVLRTVRLEEVVAGMPQGLHTPLAVHGAPLTRGQVARLCLARALINRPAVLLIDGALDELGLSQEDHRAVVQGLMHDAMSWTVLLVSEHPELCTTWSSGVARLEVPG